MQIKKPGFHLRSSVFFYIFFCFALLVLVSYSYGADSHPEKMGKKTCIQCHQEITPELVKQWQESAHGYTATGCGVCHGDQKNFKIKPGNKVCIGCHATAVEQNTLKGKSCASCHPQHHFTQHKVKDYQDKKKGGKK
jgi:Cytochrome c7 and related cytochrome c